jgi:hypothetical protein
MSFGMKHPNQEIIIFLQWVVAIVGSKIFLYRLMKLILLIFRAHKRLNSDTIRAKLIRTTLNNLKIYFGSSLPNLK